jgi:pyrimidine-nucleoside phosphorylase
MRTNQIYVGIKGLVLALDSASGEILWKTDVGGSSFITVVDDGPRLYVLAQGEAYCLDAQTGFILWHNPLKGCGYGLGCITVSGRAAIQDAVLAAQILSAEQIQQFIENYSRGAIPDYQMSALLMAVYFRGLDSKETRALTKAMRSSGEELRFAPDPKRPVVDKHSTGGIGDKVSLPLAPLLACLGFRVPMISGRGLGITGGTLDKLESIPNFRTRFTADEIVRLVEEVGCVICGQSETICPADRLMYALRDATGTVPSIPLIAASILSKKLAEGVEALVLDVKFGTAAFMQTREQARELASTMTQLANESGVKTRAILTDMNSPLGRSAGNWLEVRESVECLEGRGAKDLQELVIDCAAHLLVCTSKCANLDAGRDEASHVLDSGAPRRKWDQMLAAQGADIDAFKRKLSAPSTAPVIVELKAERDGFVGRADARIIGEAVRDLGAGRMTKEATIDFAVGLDEIGAVGEPIRRGDILCRVHARANIEAATALSRLKAAFEIVPTSPGKSPRVIEVISIPDK